MRIPPLHDVLPPGSAVTAVVPRTGGQQGTVYEVRLAGADPLIVKRYGDHGRQAKELHVYGLLERAGVEGVPRVVGDDRGRMLTALTRLPGTPVSQAGLPPDAVVAAYRRMGRFLAALHRIALPAYGYLTTGEPAADNVTFVRLQFERNLAGFREHGGPADVHDAVAARVAAGQRFLAACSGAVLCHNDLHEGNVLVDDAGAVTGFIDVENAVAADPMLDVAKTIQYDLDASAEKRAALLDGYGPLPPAGAERVALYRLYHALELWVWFATIGNTPPLSDIMDDIRSLLPKERYEY
jgi:hygromycin-B 7''-O-kinase